MGNGMKYLLPVGLIVVGVALLIGGLLLPRYHDQADYERRYMELTGPSRSSDFYELRRASLTSSLTLQDYGLCSISLGLVAFAFVGRRRVFRIFPRSRFTTALFGVAIAILTVGA